MDILAMNLSPLKNLFPSCESRNALQFVVLQSHLYFKPRSHKAACVRMTMTSMRKSVGVSRESRCKDWASGAVCVRRAKALGRSVGRLGRTEEESEECRSNIAGLFLVEIFLLARTGPDPTPAKCKTDCLSCKGRARALCYRTLHHKSTCSLVLINSRVVKANKRD